MNYPLYNLSATEFEELVVLICQKILGEGTINFAPGRDGGRDARFTGKANCYPSDTAPWTEKIVIKAKHTARIDASCSDSGFNKILKEEVETKLERLKQDKLVDFYLLFTNRRLTGGMDEKIDKLIGADIGVENNLIGEEKIQLWLKQFPGIAKIAGLQKLMLPLQFNEQDLKELVVAFKNTPLEQGRIEDIEKRFPYVLMDQKNELNNLSKTYFDNVVKTHYSHFSAIEKFLSNPINHDFKDMYHDTIDELNAKIHVKRSEFCAFEEIFEHLYDHVISNNPDLSRKKRLIRVFLHYMYTHCDIGRKE